MSLNGRVPLLPATRYLWEKNKISIERLKEVWDTCTIYIAQNYEGKVVFFSSCGRLGKGFEVGTHHRVCHDQTHAKLGSFDIVNIVDVKDGKPIKYENELHLNIKAPVWVFK